MTVLSDSNIDETQAGAQTRGASTGASSQAAGTGSGTAEAGVGAQKRFSESEVMTDIGQGEAWTANMKSMFDELQKTLAVLTKQSETLRESGVSAANLLIQQAASAAGNVIQAAGQETISKMHASSDAVQKTTRTSLFEIDKLENLDEVNALFSLIISKLAETILKKEEGA